MTLKERWKAKNSEYGEFLHNYGGKLLALIAAVGELTNMLGVIPADLIIPNWLRVAIWICAGLSFVVGKLTTKEDKKDESGDKQA